MKPIFNNSVSDVVGGGRWTPNNNDVKRIQEPITIPVRHVDAAAVAAATDTDGPAAAAVTLRGEGLQSPSVLMQSIKPARRQSNRQGMNRRSSFIS